MSEPAGPVSPELAAIGEAVRSRLLAASGVQRLPLDMLDIFVCPEFLHAEDCAQLVGMIDADAKPSESFPGVAADYRTSYSCNLDRWDEFVLEIDARICALMGIDPQNGETLQGQRYQPGQQFKAHHDFFHVNQPYWDEQNAHGGQRSWTAMIFLNQPEAGGETAFPMAGISISPRTGLLLMWDNMARDGSPNLATLHAGQPVKSGVKHIVTKWFRERPWI